MNKSKDLVTVLFIADVSGSMYGEKIQSVNAAIAECLGVLREGKNKGKNIKVGYVNFHEEMSALSFDENPDSGVFKVSPDEGGFYHLTSFACMYDGLYHILEKMDESYENLCLILITDGKPVDSGEYSVSLEKVKSLDVFRNAQKFVALARDEINAMDKDMLEFVRFNGDKIVKLSDLSISLSRLDMLLPGEQSKATFEEKFNPIFDD